MSVRTKSCRTSRAAAHRRRPSLDEDSASPKPNYAPIGVNADWNPSGVCTIGYPTRPILAVVPTYNEAGNLPELVGSVFARVPDIHLLVVDDSSPDGTGEIADKIAAEEHPGQMFVMHRKVKDGLGRAYVAGFSWALERDYAAVVQMDADLSHDPLYLPSMIEAAENADVVIGSRYLNGISVINWPLRRILLSWGANKYVRFWTRVPVNDGTSGYRVYRRPVLEGIDLPTIKSNGYSFQVEMTFRAHVAGFKIAEVPIIFIERREGQSKMSKGVIFESMQMPIRLRFRERALRRKLAGNASRMEPVQNGSR